MDENLKTTLNNAKHASRSEYFTGLGEKL